jgi:hypothetical protein
MRSPAWRAFVVVLGICLVPVTALAQGSEVDRVVGPDFFGKPLVIRKLTANDIGALGAAAGVPMGFEAAPPGEVPPLQITATGRTLRAVLDAIVAADSRYEWRDETGVAVLRAVGAWTDRDNPLHRTVAAIRFADAGVNDALRIVVALFGQELHRSQRTNLGNPRRFTLDVPPGTVLEALNAIVRAHGALSWGVEPFPVTPLAPGSTPFPYMASLVSGASGQAAGIGIHLDREPRIPDEIERWGRPEPASTLPPLDRVVGNKANGEPMVLRGAYDVAELAFAARAPMGVELLRPDERHTAVDGTNVTGLTLREALTALMRIDSRYEWREMEGAIVVRPLAAWAQPDHPLLRRAGLLALERATVVDAACYLQTLLEPRLRYVPERDRGVEVPRITVTIAKGSPVLSLLNGIARSFGELCWIYEELDERETAFFGGRSHQISLRHATGEGRGFAFR